VTDWGDHGHWQQLPISFFGFISGSGFCWNSNESLAVSKSEGIKRIGEILDVHVFKSKGFGQTLLDLGNAYLSTNALIGNQSTIFRMILFPATFPTLTTTQRPNSENLGKTEKLLKEAKERLAKNEEKIRREDREIIKEELEFTFDLMIFACQFGREYAALVWEQGKDKVSVAEVPFESKTNLHQSLEALIKRFEACWSKRNKPGGLKESVGRLQSLLAQLK